jgi:hypothetical protein
MKYVIATQFSDAPGGRYIEDGPLSGELFRETVLKPLLEEHPNEKFFVDLDGGFGYAPSFLEESFGGLAREIGPDMVESLFEFKSDDEPDLINKLKEYIKNAKA